MKQYTLCIAESKNNDIVLLKKTAPEWQAGLYNFPGGKVEGNESYYQGAIREFKEETGVELDFEYKGCISRKDDFEMRLFYCMSDAVKKVKTNDKEEVILVSRPQFYKLVRENKTISNLAWVYEFVIDRDNPVLTITYPTKDVPYDPIAAYKQKAEDAKKPVVEPVKEEKTAPLRNSLRKRQKREE